MGARGAPRGTAREVWWPGVLFPITLPGTVVRQFVQYDTSPLSHGASQTVGAKLESALTEKLDAQMAKATKLAAELATVREREARLAGDLCRTHEQEKALIERLESVGRELAGIAGHELAGDFASRAPQGVIREMAELVRCEGPRSLFKGYVAKVARLGPGSALIFAVYEQMLQVI
ncbi:unnamed protein product [Prorocentrum cordatum]|uniref:Uncharacterized protein n=1 Tax=Prorocentrum cordatum TaxID=2364126 RepID=A0ABN9PI26_9DINO|nr:unnamed protein product [Polarella glacialis]